MDNPFLGQNNPYLQNVIDSASRDMVNNYNLSEQPSYNNAMVRSGSFGNSGVEQMNQNAQSQLQQNLGDLSSKMRFNDYTQQQGMYQWQNQFDEGQRQFNNAFNRNIYQWDQDFNRTLFNDAYTQNMNNLQTGIGLLGTLSQYNQGDLNTATTVQNTPLNYLTQFTNMSGALGRGGQTSTMTNAGGGSSPVTSALGGAQLGRAVGNWWNSGSGGNNILSTPATGYSNYDGNGGGWNAWANLGSGAD